MLVAVAAASLSFDSAALDRFFEISWEEEVELHDGTKIWLRFRFSYERLSASLFESKFKHSILRDTFMSFDAGPPWGRVEQWFRRQRPVLLDRDDSGQWFVVLEGASPPPPGVANPDWGSDQNGNGNRMGRLERGEFIPASLRSLPAWVAAVNLLQDYAPLEELAKFDKTRVTLADKRKYLEKYPLAPSGRHIARPQK